MVDSRRPRCTAAKCGYPGIDPEETIFIDDVQANVAAAADIGIHGIGFTSPEALRRLIGLVLALIWCPGSLRHSTIYDIRKRKKCCARIQSRLELICR
jgi:FMN phosphatase YigB (HAD superfamily)